ncbi:MAG: RNA methyltransferase [Synechococcales cyanobacterium T60_A2020_003]|nr:RNA methyltransferase [Synechococcales cyanobacterium T60_A2020_003]
MDRKPDDPIVQTLSSVRIVLVEPAGDRNVGAIARVMKNMGLYRLVIVQPRCDCFGEEARIMAVHAEDVLTSAQVVDSLPDALKGCQRAIATTARDRDTGDVLEEPRSALPWLVQPLLSGERPETALIFGPEDRGLSNAELNYAQRFVRIPSSEVYPSLNLAQSVAVCAYELRQSILNPTPFVAEVVSQPSADLASLDELEGYFEQLESLLLRIEYLYPHTAASRMEKLRRLFKRAGLASQEVAMLRGMLRQMAWALDGTASPEIPREAIERSTQSDR